MKDNEVNAAWKCKIILYQSFLPSFDYAIGQWQIIRSSRFCRFSALASSASNKQTNSQQRQEKY